MVAGDRSRRTIRLDIARAVIAPAAAIMLGGVAQPLLMLIWPGIRALSRGEVSADSYIPVVVSAVLCFVVGHWFGSRTPTTASTIALALFPLLWLVWMVWTIRALGARTWGEWVSPIAVCLDLTAVVPLIAIFAGLAAASLGRRN